MTKTSHSDLVLTYSSMSTFLTCPKMYYWRYVEEIVPIKTKSYFIAGRAAHAALEKYYNLMKCGERPADHVGEILSKIDEELDSSLDGSVRDIEYLEKIENEAELIKKVIERYIKFWDGKESFNVLDVEMKFELPLIHGVKFAGKVDGIIEDDGLLYLLEHKTVSKLDQSYKARLSIDAQILKYASAVEKVLGRKVHGVMYNVLVKSVPPEPRVLKNGGLSKATNYYPDPDRFEEVVNELGLNIEDYKDHIKWLKEYQKEYFYRVFVPVSDEQKVETWEEMKKLAKAIRLNTRYNWFFKNDRQCFWNNKRCRYHDLCSARKSEIEYTLEAFYKKEERNSELI